MYAPKEIAATHPSPDAYSLALQGITHFGYDPTYAERLTEGQMNEVAALGSPPVALLKVPRQGAAAQGTVLFEGLMVSYLHGQEAAPVAVPQHIECAPWGQAPYNLFSYVPGTVLVPAELATFSQAERQNLGKDLGSFIVWLANTIGEEEYNDALSVADIPPWMSRKDVLERRLKRREKLEEAGHTALVDILSELHHDYDAVWQECADRGGLIVCHNDLRPANMTFSPDKHTRRLRALSTLVS